MSMKNSPRSKRSSPASIKSKLKKIAVHNAYIDSDLSPTFVILLIYI